MAAPCHSDSTSQLPDTNCWLCLDAGIISMWLSATLKVCMENYTNSNKCTFLNENVWIRAKILPKFAPKDPINNIPALV